ncbi:hypothetical protein HDV00_001677 [Rhizophlyctis rosea]|nr:hypothetical protein HDV00_001677 [Rhizophlyctis rosea]
MVLLSPEITGRVTIGDRPLMQAVPGEQVVRGLAEHVRTHHAAILSASKAAAEQLDELTTRAGRPLADPAQNETSHTGTTASISSFFGLGSSKAEVSSTSSTTAIPSSLSPFTLDPQQLAYLQQLFTSSESVQSYIQRREERGNVTSDDPFSSTGQASTTGYGLSFLWGGRNSDSSLVRPLDEEILLLFRFLERLPILRLAPVAQNSIAEQTSSEPPTLSLCTYAPSLVSLELRSVHPRVVSDWHDIRNNLISIVCENAIVDVIEIIEAVGIAQSNDEDDDLPVLLPTITHLSLSGNSLISFPETFTAHVPSLIHLDLSNNIFTSVPDSLSSLSQLQTLNLSNNRITSLAGAEDRIRNVTILSLKGNQLENLMGVETLAALRILDVRDNKLWDVFEVGRLAALVDISDIRVKGNPLTRLEHYRINVFMYFKERAFNLSLDDAPPNPAEQKAIRSNLTVASAPKKPSMPLTHRPGSNVGNEGSSAADETDRQSLMSVSVTGRSVKSDGKRGKKGKKVKRSKKARSEANPTLEEENEEDVKEGSSVKGSSAALAGEKVGGSVESVKSGGNVEQPAAEGDPSRTVSETSLVSARAGQGEGVASVDVTPRQSVTETGGGVGSPPRVRRFTQIENAMGVIGGGADEGDVLVSRVGRKGVRVGEGKKVKKDKTGGVRIRDGDEERPRSAIDSVSVLGTSPVSSAGDGYRRKIEALKSEAGSDWMKVYLGMQEQERREKEAEAERKRKEVEYAKRKAEEEEEEARRQREEVRKLEEQIRRVAAGESEAAPEEVKEGDGEGTIGETVEPEVVTPAAANTPASPALSTTSAPTTSGRLPAPPNVGHITHIGPYRRIYDYGFRASSSDAGSRTGIKSTQSSSVGDLRKPGSGLGGRSGTSPQLPRVGSSDTKPKDATARPSPLQRRTSSGPDVSGGTSKEFTGISPPARTIVRPLPPLVFAPGSPPSHNLSSTVPTQGTPPLILSRPVNSATSYTRSRTNSEAGEGSSNASKSYTVSYSTYSASGYRSRGKGAAYLRYRDMNGDNLSSEAGSSRPGGGSGRTMPVPRAPTIPFREMTNNLLLFLKTRILKDEERVMCWCAGSYVPQLPAFVGDISSSRGTFGEWFSRRAGKVGGGGMGDVGSVLRSVEPVERMVWMLLTDWGIYFFSYSGAAAGTSARGGSGRGRGDGQYLSVEGAYDGVRDMVRYDEDPGKVLRLVHKVRLEMLARVDVGFHRQYLGVHFLKEKVVGGGGVKGAAGGIHPGAVGGIGKVGGEEGKGGGSGGGLVGGEGGVAGEVVSLVVLIRDKTTTTKFIDSVTEVIYERGEADGGRFARFKGEGGKVRIINQDVEWCVRAIRDRVLVRQGPKARHHAGGTIGEGGGGGLGGWIGRLLGGKATGKEVVRGYGMGMDMLGEDEEDPAVGDDVVVSKVDFNFVRTYLLAGWIVPRASSSSLSSSSRAAVDTSNLTVRPVTVIATKTYIYLVVERLDVWPPVLFPPESLASPSVNACIDSVVPGMSERYGGKGLVSDVVGEFTGVVGVGRVGDVVKCERWKTWRFGCANGVGGLVQNGVVGRIRGGRGRSGGGGDLLGLGVGNAGGWSWWVRVTFSDGKKKGQGEDKAGGGGASAGGEGAKAEGEVSSNEIPTDQPQAEPDGPSSTSTPDAPSAEIPHAQPDIPITSPLSATAPPQDSPSSSQPADYWDLVFSTLDSSNEFLEFVRETRGVKPLEESLDVPPGVPPEEGEDVLSDGEGSHVGDEEDCDEEVEDGDENVSLDTRLLRKVRKDGVVFVIGDD